MIKTEGDILMELRNVEAAIVSYKELVSQPFLFFNCKIRKTFAKKISYIMKRCSLINNLVIATG